MGQNGVRCARYSRQAACGGAGSFLYLLAGIPLAAWNEAYFELAVVASELSIKRAVVVSDPAAIRRVLLENCDNSEKDSGPLTVEDQKRRTPHSKTI